MQYVSSCAIDCKSGGSYQECRGEGSPGRGARNRRKTWCVYVCLVLWEKVRIGNTMMYVVGLRKGRGQSNFGASQLIVTPPKCIGFSFVLRSLWWGLKRGSSSGASKMTSSFVLDRVKFHYLDDAWHEKRIDWEHIHAIILCARPLICMLLLLSWSCRSQSWSKWSTCSAYTSKYRGW